jgi:lysophospholipase L1-like esterase
MVVYAKTQPTGGTTSDAAAITSGVLDIARIPTIPASKLAADAATQAELDTAVALRQLADSDLTTIAAMTPATGDMLVGQGGVWSKKTVDQVRAALGISSGSIRSAPLLILDGALTARKTTPARIVFAGSSTTAGSNASAPAKRWVNTFMTFLQTAYPSGAASEPPTVADVNGAFGTITPLPGVQGFNIGQSSTTAATFLTDAESQILTSLDPSVIFYMVGSNDFGTNVPISTFTTNLQNRINYNKARLLNRPCAHILVGAYERWDVTGTTPWAQYGGAMQAIADASPSDTLCVDLNSRYVAYNIPGAKGLPGGAGAPGTDPNGLISSDKIHQNDTGHEQMARWIYQDVMGVPPLNPGTTTPPGTGTASPVTDNFARTSTNTLGAAVTGQTWSINTGSTWATDGSVAFMTSGTNGLATATCGYSDVTFNCKVRRPASGTCGIRVRQSESINTGMALYFDSASNLVLLSTVINGTITVKDSLAVPADVAVGDYATLTISANGAEIIGFVNGVRLLSTTLTAGDVTALPGTSIALRQTVAGIANGAFDDVDADTVQIVVPPAANTVVNDTFTRAASTTSLGVASSGQTWTSGNAAIWGISASGKAYLVSLNGATGGALALLPTGGISDIDFTADFVRPTAAAFTGIAVRATAMTSRIACYVDVAANQLVISTVEASTNTARATFALPTSLVAVGATMKVRLTVVGAVVNAYLNDAATPTLSYTLTGTQITGITGTDIGLRQNSSGEANGSFDNVVVLNLGTTTVDPALFPTGDIAGQWKLEWNNDFNTTFALGQARTQLGSALFGYDGGKDTSQWGTYNSAKTVSGVAGAISGGGQGYLNIHPYWDATDSKYYIVSLTPPPPTATTGSTWGQMSGRYSIRMRIINNVKGSYVASDGTTKTDTGFKVAYLNWPAVSVGNVDPKGVTIIDPWDYGELNWPEGNTAGSAEAFAHFATGSAGSRNHGNALAYQPGNIPMDGWHTYTVEWISGVSVKYYLDGVLKTQAPASGVPFVKMYWSMQTETWLNTAIAPPKAGSCDIQIDWAASYSKI